MIRPAEPKDAAALARMGEAFFAGIKLSGVIPFDAKSLFSLITMENVGTFVIDNDGEVVGAGSVLVYPFSFNNSYLAAQELFWWVDPEYRRGTNGLDLYRAIEGWAKDHGANIMFMIAIENDCIDKVTRLYNRYGYEKTEHTFMKEL